MFKANSIDHDSQVNAMSSNGDTSMHNQHSAQVNAMSSNGDTSMHNQHSAQVNAKSSFGNTSMHNQNSQSSSRHSPQQKPRSRCNRKHIYTLNEYVQYYGDAEDGEHEGKQEFKNLTPVIRSVSIICLTCSNIYSRYDSLSSIISS